MKKQILLIACLVLAVVLSVSAISANDVNVTGSYATNLVDDSSDVSVRAIDEADSSQGSVSIGASADSNVVDSSKVSLSSDEVLESDSNNLSTNNLGSSSDTDSVSAKASTSLEASNVTMYYKNGKIVATLLDANGKGIAGQTVAITINGVSYSRITDSNGMASLAIGLRPNTYAASVEYAGSSTYDAATKVSITVKVLPTIVSKDLTKYYKSSNQYTATFYNGTGGALANTNVKVSINGKTYTYKTNDKGVVTVAINLKPGTYEITAQDPVTGYKLSNTVKVLETIKASDLSKVYTDSKGFSATFLDGSGKALANKNVKFVFNGRTYTVRTNANGVATLALSTTNPGTYKVQSVNVDGYTKTNTVKIYRTVSSKIITSSYMFLTSETKTVRATLHNQFNYAPGAGKTVTLTVNGRTYTGSTNGNGVVSFTLGSLNAGSYTATYKFAGNSFYTASSATNKVIILSSKTTKLTVKSSSTFGKGANTPFKVALTASGVAMDKRTVSITINGNTYTKTTDSSGIASLPIGLKAGKYDISYSFAGESKLNPCSGKTTITVKERSPTTVNWKTGTTYYQGAQTYKVLLLDSNGKILTGKTVKLNVASKDYTVTTSSYGYAIFSVNVGPGEYTVKYSFDGDNDNAPSSGSTKISVVKKDFTGYGYWVFGGDMKNVNLASLAAQGTSDIFLNYASINKWGQSVVESWIATANSNGIRVHIWMQTLYKDGKWINPKTASSSTINSIVNEAKSYAQIKGVAGVHLDYLRYPGTAYKTSGGTDAISSLTQKICNAVHGVNSNCIVSAAIMPETTNNAYYYGQDMSVLSKYLDVVVPMIYKGNYKSSTSWITTTAKWFVDNSKGAQIWVGLQAYESDDKVVKLSLSDLTKDCQAALDGKASGVVLFRWGITNFVDFNKLSDKSSGTTTGSKSISSITYAAKLLKEYIETNKALPASVSVGGDTYTVPQFLYLMTSAVTNIKAGSTSEVLPVSCAQPSGTQESVKEDKLYLDEYVDIAGRISNYIKSNSQAPHYANSASLGKIYYNSFVDAYARILAYYRENNQLPNYVTLANTVNSGSDTPTGATVSINSIISGARTVKSYYDSNGKLPTSVKLTEGTFTMQEFLYLMSKAIVQLGSSNTKSIASVTGVKAPASADIQNINSQQLVKKDYIDLASRVANYIAKNGQAPGYATATVGNVVYSELGDSFSRILVFYADNDKYMPNYVTISQGSSSSGSYPSSITALAKQLTSGLTSERAKAVALYNWVRDYISYSFYYNTQKGAAGTLTARSGNCCDQAQLLVALARASGLTARFATGYCTFSSGSYGHVWVQLKVDGSWHAVDTTSTRNTYDKIVNWNTASYTNRGTYNTLPY